ncbi:hypothetical protein BKA61DRAFT_657494 [Leptodontidium sp. MPI-SDFR-AT-0119]|nr:hypothetical protein BKA61DRAFT_657494 [Leptodontidium sp. MPI-SDFR-AT-0119]
MVTRGFWNVRRGGQWYQIHEKRGRISSTGDASTYTNARRLQDNLTEADRAVPIPFPLPLQQNLNYIYTLDLDSAHLTVAFWHREEGDSAPGLALTMRRLGLDSIERPADLSIEALLNNGGNPLLETSHEDMLPGEIEYDGLEIDIGQPSSLSELQHRMFVDFVYQWRVFLDDHTLWPDPSTPLFRRLCIAILRLAAWDLEVSSEGSITSLPLGAEDFPRWDSPASEVYWFHGYLVVLCQDLDATTSFSAAVLKGKEFLRNLDASRTAVNCILVSISEVAMILLSTDQIRCSAVFPLVSNSSATQCSPGFRILSYLLSASDIKWEGRNLSARENSSTNLPLEVYRMVLGAVEPFDVVSFAQASFVAQTWYYSSLPQFPNMTIHHLDVSIPCCGNRHSECRDGVSCSNCYVWQHSECITSNKHTLKSGYICSRCRASEVNSDSPPRLMPGAIGRANLHVRRLEGCRVFINNHEKALNLRTTSPAVMRPELRFMDRDLTSTPPNQIDYVVIFNGVWSGLAYGLDNLRSETSV